MGYVGANVRRHRLKLGMNQKALGDAAGLHANFIQRIEAGKVNLTLASLLVLADTLGIPPSALLRKASLPKVKRGRPRKTVAPNT
jgi:transcriptional regulator with XRE-family HTH domain